MRNIKVERHKTTIVTSRELTSAHSQQPDSNWETLVSERKLLTTKRYGRLSI